MADYIRRADALHAIYGEPPDAHYPGWYAAILMDLPAADVAEVVHGEWVLLDDCSNSGLYCSVCRRRVHREDFAYKKLRSKYCPHCGAKMDGGENDVSG